jgi:Domain of unknown function (DUF4838)
MSTDGRPQAESAGEVVTSGEYTRRGFLRRTALGLGSLGLLGCPGPGAAAEKSPVASNREVLHNLVQDGQPAATIVVAAGPTPAARLAALELQHHLEQITGARLPIRHPDEPAVGVRILVGESAATRRLGLKGADFKPQEYLIRIREDVIVLMGRDWQDTPANRRVVGCDISKPLAAWRTKINYDEAVGRKDGNTGVIELPGPFDDEATCYAVYDFLERFCDVRWYGPSPVNIVVPSRKTLGVPRVELRRTPSLLHRNGYAGGIWPIILEQWDHPSEAHQRLFYRRLRFGGERWAANHSFSGYRARFLVKDHDHPEVFERSRPDFFAVGWENEGSWRQLCLTNPALVQQVVQDARDFFDGKPPKLGQMAAGVYFAVVPQDSDHWCKCERCQAILQRGKDRAKPGYFESGSASDYVFQFVNAVARGLRKTHPDKYITTLAYHDYSYPPAFPVEANVAVAPCLATCYSYDKANRAHTEEFYSQWIAQKRQRTYVWNYFHHPMEVAILHGWNCFPCFMPEIISYWVKRYERDGVRGFYLCAIGQQVDYYLYMQTAFNTDTDYRQLIDEFFSRYFGAAAEPMKRFYYRISEINRQEGCLGTTQKASWERLGTEARMKELGALIQRAVALAGTDLERSRVATWKKGVWDYMAKGRQEYLWKKQAYAKKEFSINAFGTGVDDQGRLLDAGAPDPHWRLAQSADPRWKGPQAYVYDSIYPPLTNGTKPSTTSKWITPSADLRGVAPGLYVYEQTFTLVEKMDLKTASIVGRTTGDDQIERIEFNGVNLGHAAGADFSGWRELILTEHFLVGTNTLRITVRNAGSAPNPQGLRVELRGSADGKKPQTS